MATPVVVLVAETFPGPDADASASSPYLAPLALAASRAKAPIDEWYVRHALAGGQGRVTTAAAVVVHPKPHLTPAAGGNA